MCIVAWLAVNMDTRSESLHPHSHLWTPSPITGPHGSPSSCVSRQLVAQAARLASAHRRQRRVAEEQTAQPRHASGGDREWNHGN